MKELIEAFNLWYANDPHSKNEDHYIPTINGHVLENLSKKEFVNFFSQFAKDGGLVQSGGQRTAPLFISTIKNNYTNFRLNILKPFKPNFNLNEWLKWADEFRYFGKGLASIYLNRINKTKYVIVNNKSFEGLRALGFEIPNGGLFKQYESILEAETSLLQKFPALSNFFKIDALMQFIIGTNEGQKLMKNLEILEYFDLGGLNKYRRKAGKPYNSEDNAVVWYKDTREKLNYLVALLGEKTRTNLIVNYSEKPNGQKGRGKIIFKEYVLTGFSPDGIHPNGDLFIKLAFHNLNSSPVFEIEIDINTKLKDNPYFNQRQAIRDASNFQIPIDHNFPKSWNELLNKIVDHISKLIFMYYDLSGKGNPQNSENLNMKSLNTILFGPPGTGKTFHSISHAVAIIENVEPEKIEEESNHNREAIKVRYEKYVADGQIVFTTFHQSMGYEDFIEGIKPIPPDTDEDQLYYDTKDGIFKKLCTEAAFSFVNPKSSPETEKALDFSTAYDLWVDEINEKLSKEVKPTVSTRSGGKLNIENITQKNNILVSHQIGTRKYTVSKKRLARLSQALPDLSKVSNINSQFRGVIGGSNSSAYWAVLNAIRNQDKISKKELLIEIIDKEYSYEDKKEIISSLTSKNYVGEHSKNYVLIIDEINRGNVSQIFGELITLIEEDKRLGNKEALKVTLPYSEESFGVPPNVHIIGTMNTADRSVEALDTALRRRFSFVPKMPEESKLVTTSDEINLSKILQTINNRLRVLKDNDHTIGHAWFWNVTNVDQLKTVFANKILPLLQEYFYNDYEKLGLVLGNPFFKVQTQINSNMFAHFTGGNGLASQYDRAWQFELKSPTILKIEDFKSLETERNLITQDEE